MKVTIILVGKTDESYLETGIHKYLDRLKHYLKINLDVQPAVKQAVNLPPDELKRKEGDLILKKISAEDYVILLDEAGKELSSMELADFMNKRMVSGIGTLFFIVGGAFGVSDAVKQRSDFTLSLSRLTFSHQMVRLFLVEQLYRAMTILRREKYHHD